MRILVFDNYDSFTYNLVHLVKKITGGDVDVYRNDEITMADIEKYDRIILSPGPGIPSEAGRLMDVIKTYAGSKPILGVCLGHQAIGEAFGGKLENLANVFHGVATKVEVLKDEKDNPRSSLFSGLPSTFDAGRYHSWVVMKNELPSELEITAVDENGIIMALKHKHFDIEGVQFHPESILTPEGEMILRNWLNKER